MPNTLIAFDANAQHWFIAVENTEIRYNFVGAAPADQYQNIQLMSELMEDDGANLAEFIGEIPNAIDIPNDVPPDVATEQLFGDSDAIIYTAADGVEHAIAAAADTMLIDDLVTIGEALLMFL